MSMTVNGHLSSTPVVAATEYPVTRREVQEHLKLDCDDDNALVDGFIVSATKQVEAFLNQQLITATWDYYLDRFSDPIPLPLSPLQSVTSVSYVDNNGDTQTLATSVYTVDANMVPGRIYRSWNENWPSIRTIRNSVTIRFVAGYGAASTVPADIKTAIKMGVADLYENLGQTTELNIADNMAYQRLLWPNRVELFH